MRRATWWMGFLFPLPLPWCGQPRRVYPGPGARTPTLPPTSSLGLRPRLLPVAAGRSGGTLCLGAPRAEGPATPSVEAVAARRVAGCPHSGGQQAAEVAAPEGSGGHGGGAPQWPSEAHPGLTTGASAWSEGGGDAAALRDSRSCPQLPAGSPQPHASSLAAWPDPSPPSLSSSDSCLSLLRFLPLSSSPLLRGVCSLCPPHTHPGLLRLVPGPLRCRLLGLHPLAPSGPPLVSAVGFPQ